MRIDAAAGSNTGKIRRRNEDNLLFYGEVLPAENDGMPVKAVSISMDAPCLMGVFDGMGGYSHGERASWIAAETARKMALNLTKNGDLLIQLKEICFNANDAVCEAAEGFEMGTTAAMLCFCEGWYYLCNIGDSPIFLLRNGNLTQISVDHNQRESFERITGNLAKPGQKFNLTQCIGIPKEEMLIEPYTSSGKLMEGDVFLICSDGITDMLSSGTIQRILSDSMDTQGMVLQLTDHALEVGGRDNITAVCIKVAAEEEKEGSLWKRFLGWIRK